MPLRTHQIIGRDYISKYGIGSSKGNFVSVACCGSGNLLAACAIAGARPTNLYGNEIDPEILEICRSRLKKLDIPESHIKQGDATKDDVWFKTLSRSRRH